MKPTHVLIIGLIFLFCALPAHSEKIVRITGCEWPPYMSEHNDYHGYASRIVSEAFASEGISIKLDFFPRKRSLYQAHPLGGWDGSILWFKGSALEKEYFVSGPVVKAKFVFFHLKGMPFEWTKIEDLKKYKIGGVLEHDYGDEFQTAEQNGILRVERVPNDEQNLKKLIYGRIDAFIQDLDVGLALKRKLKPEEAELITFHPEPLRSGPMSLILSRSNPENSELMELFNIGLKKLEDSGRYSEIMQPFYDNKLIIIANKGVRDREISKEDVMAFFLDKKTRWSDGKRIVICGLNEGIETDILAKHYLKIPTNKFLDYWNTVIFTGKGESPLFFKDKNDYIDFIKNTDGAIGYLLNDTPTEDLSVLEIK